MDKLTAELAIRALETERQRIEVAISELKAFVKESEPKPEAARRRPTETESPKASEPPAVAAVISRQSKQVTQKKAQKKGGLTPEGRARLAESTRRRNIARAAAKKAAASKKG